MIKNSLITLKILVRISIILNCGKKHLLKDNIISLVQLRITLILTCVYDEYKTKIKLTLRQ